MGRGALPLLWGGDDEIGIDETGSLGQGGGGARLRRAHSLAPGPAGGGGGVGGGGGGGGGGAGSGVSQKAVLLADDAEVVTSKYASE